MIVTQLVNELMVKHKELFLSTIWTSGHEEIRIRAKNLHQMLISQVIEILVISLQQKMEVNNNVLK